MPVQEANDFLPESLKVTDAFNVVNKTHFTIGTTMEQIKNAPWEKVGKAVGDYFSAGVAYLANRGHDEFLKDAGTTTWWAVNQHRVDMMMTDNVIEILKELGIPQPELNRLQIRNDEPNVFFYRKKILSGTIDKGLVFIPPEFAERAQNRPVEALATVTFISSQIRDLANERLRVDGSKIISMRARAAEAHFLYDVKKDNPDIELSPYYIEIMQDFPDGIESLPENQRY